MIAPELGVAEEFTRAFNEHDLDAFVATLHPEVAINAMRGLRMGIEEARKWATRAPGGVQQRIKVEEMREAGDRVVALITREWWWDEPAHAGSDPEPAGGTGAARNQGSDPTVAASEMAGADEMAWAFELRDGLIASWRSFEDRAEALEWLATAS